MKSIADVIANHPVPGVREAATRETCAQVLTELLGLRIAPKKIRFEDGVLSLSLPPVLKSAALSKQSSIQDAFRLRGLTLTTIQ